MPTRIRNISDRVLHRQGAARQPGAEWKDTDDEWVEWASHPRRRFVKQVKAPPAPKKTTRKGDD